MCGSCVTTPRPTPPLTTSPIQTPTAQPTLPPSPTVPPTVRVTEPSAQCADVNCKACNHQAGTCRRCRNSKFLFDGVCGDESICAANGMIAVGNGPKDSQYGRACVAPGDECVFDANVSCRSPKALGDWGSYCVRSIVNTDGSMACLECDEKSWLVDGRCDAKLECGFGSKYSENVGGKCNCNNMEESGTIEKVCATCNVAKVSRPGGVWEPTPKGLFRECTMCKAYTLMHEGVCKPAAECPFEMAQYSVGKFDGSCEPPFSCVGGFKGDGENHGAKCKCQDRRNCSDCSWGAGGAHQCIRCKNNMYLSNGQCISMEECTHKGLMAFEGTEQKGQGGVCV